MRQHLTNLTCTPLEGRAVKGTYSGYLRFSNPHGWGIPAGGGTAIKVGIPTGKPDRPTMIGSDNYGYDVFVNLGGREFATTLRGLRWEAMNDVFIKEWRIRAWPKGGRQTTTITKRQTQGPGQELTGLMINLPAGEWTITAQARNARGWGPPGALHNVASNPPTMNPASITAPGPVRDLRWTYQNGKHYVSWQPPEHFGYGPLDRYEYRSTSDCATEGSRPLRIRDEHRYIPPSRHEVRHLSRPDHFSVRAVNVAGFGPCATITAN